MALRPDCRNKNRALMLVKVPKYLSQHWKQQAGSSEVGRLRLKTMKFYLSNQECCNPADGSPVFSLQAQSSTSMDPQAPKIPIEYNFSMLPNNQSLVVFREEKPDKIDEIDGKQGNLTIEGKVVSRVDCNPENNETYRNFKKAINASVNNPTNQVLSIEKAEIKFKPVARHAENAVAERAKRDNKNVRLEKHALLDMLFQAFEKHQYYKLYDLARITSQPPNYVKDVLQEIANYNTMPPHKYTWELKQEYRHYKAVNSKIESSG
uniref:General transcription factor IIF subunit 2 n=1 Tax=Romanomermis culicivorax TaxID=13658 RepID=A0A915JQB4_ROMCU